MGAFNAHKISYSLYDDSLAAINFWMDKNNSIADKRAFSDKLLQAQTDGTTEFPLIHSFHYTDVDITDHQLTVHISVVDDLGHAALLKPRYTFPNVNLPQLIETDPAFVQALAFMVLQQGIVPLSMMSCNRSNTLEEQISNSAVISLFDAPGDSYAERAVKLATAQMFHEHLYSGCFLQKVLAFFAWNDRMSMTRLSSKHAMTSMHFDTLNPGYIMEAPVDYTYDVAPGSELVDLANLKALTSFSWGKESLLSAQILERICPEVCYGIVKHDYALEGAEPSKAYQADYDVFRKGTRYEDAKFVSSGNGYLTLIYNLVPMLPGVSHAMHHMYGMCHLINAWNDADAIFLGDELERNFRNALYTQNLAGSPATSTVYGYDQAVQLLKKMDIKFQAPGHYLDDIVGENGEVLFAHAGYDFGFDFHQSEHMHKMLNGVIRRFHPTKLIGSPVYNYSEIAIQFLLNSIDKQAFSYQASCWYASEAVTAGGSKWCNSCEKCHRLAWVMKAMDIDHESFGLKYVDPFTYLKPEEISGNKVFAITADRHSQGFAFNTCDAAVKFMLLRTVCEDDLSNGWTRIPAHLNYDPQQWLHDIREHLILPTESASNVVEVGPEQRDLMDDHLAAFNQLVTRYLTDRKSVV